MAGRKMFESVGKVDLSGLSLGLARLAKGFAVLPALELLRTLHERGVGTRLQRHPSPKDRPALQLIITG